MVQLTNPHYHVTPSEQALSRYSPVVVREYLRMMPAMGRIGLAYQQAAPPASADVARFVRTLPKGALGSHTLRPFPVYVRHKGRSYRFTVDPHDTASPVERLQRQIATRLASVDAQYAQAGSAQIFVRDQDNRKIEVPRSDAGTTMLIQYAYERTLPEVRPAAAAAAAASSSIGSELPPVPEQRLPYVLPVAPKKIERTAQRDTLLSRRDRLQQLQESVCQRLSDAVARNIDYRTVTLQPALHELAQHYCEAEARGDASHWLHSIGSQLVRSANSLMGDGAHAASAVNSATTAALLLKHFRKHKAWEHERALIGVARSSNARSGGGSSTTVTRVRAPIQAVHSDTESASSSSSSSSDDDSSSSSSSSSSSESSDDEQLAPDVLRRTQRARAPLGVIEHRLVCAQLAQCRANQWKTVTGAAATAAVQCDMCGGSKKKNLPSGSFVECDMCNGSALKAKKDLAPAWTEAFSYAADTESVECHRDGDHQHHPRRERGPVTQARAALKTLTNALDKPSDRKLSEPTVPFVPASADSPPAAVVLPIVGAATVLADTLDGPSKKQKSPNDSAIPFVPETEPTRGEWREEGVVYLEPLSADTAAATTSDAPTADIGKHMCSAGSGKKKKRPMRMQNAQMEVAAAPVQTVGCKHADSKCSDEKRAACANAIRVRALNAANDALECDVVADGTLTIAERLKFGQISAYTLLKGDAPVSITVRQSSSGAALATVKLERSGGPRALTLAVVRGGATIQIDDSEVTDDVSFPDFERVARVRIYRLTAASLDSQRMVVSMQSGCKNSSTGAGNLRNQHGTMVRVAAGGYRVEARLEGAATDAVWAALDVRKFFVGNTYTVFVLGGGASGSPALLLQTTDSRHAQLKCRLTTRFDGALKRAMVVGGEQQRLPAGVLIAPVNEHVSDSMLNGGGGKQLLADYFCEESPSNSIRLSDARGVTTLVSRSGVVYPLNDVRTAMLKGDKEAASIAAIYDHPDHPGVVVVAMRGTHAQMGRQDAFSAF